MAFIRRKKRGTTFYYELVENFRERGKVVQRVLKYFPDLESANLYCEKKGIRKFESKYLIPPSLKTRILNKLKKLNSQRPLSKQVLKNLREKFEVDMTYNSNAIEGNRLTLRETWMVIRKGITIGGKTIEEHLEAKNHLEALNHLHKLVGNRKKITQKDVLELHKLVMNKVDDKIAGRYRKMQVYIQGAVHLPPPAKKVPPLMKKVINELNNKKKGMDAIKSASKIHHSIAWIHPFADGNGRIARLLLNLRLMRVGFPPTILRKTERKAYYSALEKADDNDLYPITTLIAKDIERALDLWLSSIKK